VSFRRRVGWVFAGSALVASAFACGDLFHDTNFESACGVDAAACVGPEATTGDGPAEIGTGSPTNFCAWSSTTARANALHACAWLGACAGPLGNNAFGACMRRAILAYDCNANPNRPVLGAAHAFWDGLWRASSCAAVSAVVEPGSTRGACGASSFAYVACEPSPNASTRLACAAGTGGGDEGRENCAAMGQTCTVAGATAICSGSMGVCQGAGVSCAGTELHDCDPDGGVDLGVDCASFGSGACVTPGACAAQGDAGCAATTVVTCAGDVATGCPSGTEESVDCSALLGATGSCSPSAAGRGWDVSRACAVGACGADSCAGTVLQSCVQGVPVSVDCATLGFSSCSLVSVPGDPVAHGACGPP
jgi:hypothetical protein